MEYKYLNQKLKKQCGIKQLLNTNIYIIGYIYIYIYKYNFAIKGDN